MHYFKRNEQKVCFFCRSESVKKNGKVGTIQLYKYKVSQNTIRRRLDSLRSTRIVSSDKRVVVLMDTSYWGWKFGVVVFKDARTGKILWRKFISKRETLADYQ